MIKRSYLPYYFSLPLTMLLFFYVLSAIAGPLHKAAVNGTTVEVIKLIAGGADINEKKAFSKKTPLMYAASYGRQDVVRVLLSKGAAVNNKDTLGNTALMNAVEIGNFDIVSALLTKGADVNAANLEGETALMIATFNNHIEIVKHLLTNLGSHESGFFCFSSHWPGVC